MKTLSAQRADTYIVKLSVKGASRIIEKHFDSYTLALDCAVRWGKSNSQGSYVARIWQAGKIIERVN